MCFSIAKGLRNCNIYVFIVRLLVLHFTMFTNHYINKFQKNWYIGFIFIETFSLRGWLSICKYLENAIVPHIYLQTGTQYRYSLMEWSLIQVFFRDCTRWVRVFQTFCLALFFVRNRSRHRHHEGCVAMAASTLKSLCSMHCVKILVHAPHIWSCNSYVCSAPTWTQW